MSGVVVGHLVVWIVLALILLGFIVLAVLRPSPERLGRTNGSRRFARSVGAGLGGVVALYLVGRAVAEFFTVDYSNPASYRDSWGGPSLVGVFLVHAGPGVVIVLAAVVSLLHRGRGHRGPRHRTRAAREDRSNGWGDRSSRP